MSHINSSPSLPIIHVCCVTDLTNESKRRSVVMYPVSISDLGDAKLQEYMDRCIHFHVVFQNDWQFKEKTTDG